MTPPSPPDPPAAAPAPTDAPPRVLRTRTREQILRDHDRDGARVADALVLLGRYGQIPGDHHRAWVIDQVARILTGRDYDAWVDAQRMGADGPGTYDWDEGVAP